MRLFLFIFKSSNRNIHILLLCSLPFYLYRFFFLTIHCYTPNQNFPNIKMHTIRSCLNRLFAVLSMDTFTKFYSSIICSLFFTPSGYLLYLIPSISNHFYFYPFVHSFILHNIFTSDKFYHIT